MNNKKHKIYISNTEFEVSEKEYTEYYREKNHSDYLRRQERKATVLSFDWGEDSLSIEDIVADERVSVEEAVINNILIEELSEVLKNLNKDELELIDKLIYQEISARKLAKMRGVSPSTVDKRWRKLRAKLRNLME